MDLNNPIIKLCVDGSRAELEGRVADAKVCYQQAWDAAQNDYEACIAAHFVVCHDATPAETLHWNQVALERADAVADERVQGFYGSLYLNLGHSHEVMGDQTTAHHYYALAATLGFVHGVD